MGYWINLLMKGQLPEMWITLLAAPVVEEIAKYLGLRQTRSVIIPLVFLTGESLVQMLGNPLWMREIWIVWLFTIPFSIMMLKHILFYVVMYLCNFGLHGLVLAIVAHSVWNWYVVAPGEWDRIPLSLIVLAVTVLPAIALYKYEKGASDG
jgi:hypothetical protein